MNINIIGSIFNCKFVDLLFFHGQCIFVDIMINDVGIKYILSIHIHV